MEKQREDAIRRLGHPVERVIWAELDRPGSSARGSAPPEPWSLLAPHVPPDPNQPRNTPSRSQHTAVRFRCVVTYSVCCGGAGWEVGRAALGWGRGSERGRGRSGHRPACPLHGERRHRDSCRARRGSGRGGGRRAGHHRPRHRRGMGRGGRGGRVHGITWCAASRSRARGGTRRSTMLGYLTDADDGPLALELARGAGVPVHTAGADGRAHGGGRAYPWGTTRCSPRWARARPLGAPTSRTPSSPTARSGTGTRRSSPGSATTRPTTSATTRRTNPGGSSSFGPPVACR